MGSPFPRDLRRRGRVRVDLVISVLLISDGLLQSISIEKIDNTVDVASRDNAPFSA
jgi:hypothetical protein